LLRAEPNARAELVERAIAENWDSVAARRAVGGWKVTFQNDSFERHLERQL
jgi:hypothetical protein